MRASSLTVDPVGPNAFPQPLRDAIDAALALGGADATLARAISAAVGVALAAGATIDPSESGWERIAMRDRLGNRFLLLVRAWALPVSEPGADADVFRLTRSVATALGDWRFLMHLKRQIPEGFDPDPVARAVQLWRIAMDKGEWRGRNAVYEDDWVSVELSVTDQKPGGGVWHRVGPLPAPDRLVDVYATGLGASAEALIDSPDAPVVLVAVAEPGWRLPRGYVLDLLYGTPDCVFATKETFEASFAPTGISLFSDAEARQLGALWWLDNDGSLKGISYENPWAERRAEIPFPGIRFVPIERRFDSGRLALRPLVTLSSLAAGVSP